MDREPVFLELPPSTLEQIGCYLAWNPVASTASARLLSQLAADEKRSWLHAHRQELEDQFSWVGTPIFSYAVGNRRSYREVVIALAEQVRAEISHSDPTADIETKIVSKVWNDALSRLRPEQRDELLSRANALAKANRTSLGKEAGALATLSVAQMSGFGVYIFGSTLLGAINSALGLGLGFGAFTGLSSLISLVIGPLGWASVGLMALRKLGAPNYRKLLPVVVLIAAERALATPAPVAPIRAPEAAETKAYAVSAPSPNSPEKTAPFTDIRRIEEKKIEIKRSTDQFASSQAQKIIPVVQERRTKASKSDITIWNLSNADFHKYLRENDYLKAGHFLDMSKENQEISKELYNCHLEDLAEKERSKREAEKAVQTASRQRQDDERKGQRDMRKWRQRHSSLLNLEFHDEAVERLIVYEECYDSSLGAFGDALGKLNLSTLKVKCRVKGTKVNESEAKYGYRLYWRPDGDPKNLVLLVGDKGSQRSDHELLRGRLRSAEKSISELAR